MARYRTYNPDQMLLICPDIKEMIAPQSPVWMVVEMVNAELVRGLETSKSEEGNAAYNPLMMARLLVWSYFNQVHSSRKIARKAWTDVEYIYVCGMQHPDFRTICKFRKNNATFLSGLYKLLYRTAREMELTKVGVLSIDGSHFSANASGKKNCRRISKWREIEKELDRKIADFERKCDEVEREEDLEFGPDNGGGLPDEYVDAKKRQKKIREVLDKLKDEEAKGNDPKVSLADPDARYLKKNSKSTFGYNVGLAVDENLLIADVAMTNVSADHDGLKAAIENIERATGERIPEGTKVLCDNGYFSAENIDYLEKKKLDGYIAPNGGLKLDLFEQSWRARPFEYLPDEDALFCRDCNILTRQPSKNTGPGTDVKFKAREDCTGCSFKEECRPQRRHKTVNLKWGIEHRTRMTEKMLTDESKETYVKRKTTVEPTFGDIKKNLGLRTLSVRGFASIVELGLAALCHNIKRLAKMTNVFAVKWRYA